MTDAIVRLGILKDSGPPKGSVDYTTIVLLHGYAWSSAIFSKLIPLASRHNARVVLVNRRDYPSSAPYTIEERAVLLNAAIEVKTNPLAAREKLHTFMRERAREVYDLLLQFVAQHKIPPARPEENTGGIVIGGWSFGTGWMTSLLANVASFPVQQVDLSRYVRRVIFYDASYSVLGFPTIPNATAPLNDPSIPYQDVTARFAVWCSAYFDNGESSDKYQYDNHLASPPPTVSILTQEEREATFHPVPGDPRGGSDQLLMRYGAQSGVFTVLRKSALRLPPTSAQSMGDSWRDVEVRHLWCDRSPWVIPWAETNMRRELEEERKAGIVLRNVTFFRMRGANHFVHWVEPERAMHAILAVAPGDGANLVAKL
ncbi:hypothetical protein LXA43DRAFT_1022497 [Ganoderma leucocontextum]|nr:hypothetical protein LXA43DRAFT_1022497 [Ganoderma leucocontextum]